MTSSPPPSACPAHALTTGLPPLSSATTCADPRGVYRRLREQWGSVARVELEPGVAAWLVMGYEEILTITRQERLYSRDARNWRDFQEGVVAPDSGLGPMMFWRANVIGADGAEHRRLRRPLDYGVAKIDQRRMRRSVQATCTELITGFAGQGSADLVAQYAAVIPMLAVADLFGLDTGQGHELLVALMALFGSADDSQAGNRRFEEILSGVMHARRHAPTGDLTSVFLANPELRNDDEILQSIVVMVSAGYETTTTWIAQTLRLMLTDPRFEGRLRGGRLGVDDALDEVLWRDPPMSNMPARYALRDTELGGRRIQRGDALILGLAAANDDPRVHTDDSSTELGNRAHLAWSAGPHACPAQVPARIITRTAVETALHLLPHLRLAVPAEAITPRPSPWTRCPASLPVHFTPSVAHSTARP
ncbi:cytochrome P450 [Streptosporangium sp. NPDC051022]|uniref:cytochrome P450 n=1 Tax=Streptosporangium sp. NPDC051022 TaxID=3155752 RepID=UPI00344A5195